MKKTKLEYCTQTHIYTRKKVPLRQTIYATLKSYYSITDYSHIYITQIAINAKILFFYCRTMRVVYANAIVLQLILFSHVKKEIAEVPAEACRGNCRCNSLLVLCIRRQFTCRGNAEANLRSDQLPRQLFCRSNYI